MTDQFKVPGKASVIIDGQFGSTGKGLIAAYIAQRNQFDFAVTNASANAGHTTVIGERKFITYHLPTTMIIDPDCHGVLDAGAIIDVEVLLQEIEEHGIQPDRLSIHPYAATIQPAHKEAERMRVAGTTKTGSTQKGCGAALASKIMRQGNVAIADERLKPYIRAMPIQYHLDEGRSAVIEVPQGYSLGINSGFHYPFTTSRDVTVSLAMADAGLHPSALGKVLMSARTYPIRVGNIFDEDGKQIGWSGPGYPDQDELNWEQIGVAAEITTVTKRPRRIFSWSQAQWIDATTVIRPDFVFLNFVNYYKSQGQLMNAIRTAGEGYVTPGGQPFTHFGIGPDVADVFESASDTITAMYERGKWS